MKITSRFKLLSRRLILSGLPLLLAGPASADESEIFYMSSVSEVAPNVLFLLDSSGSMDIQVPESDDKMRMEIMQEAFRQVLAEAPSNLNIGLMHYANSPLVDSYQWDFV